MGGKKQEYKITLKNCIAVYGKINKDTLLYREVMKGGAINEIRMPSNISSENRN